MKWLALLLLAIASGCGATWPAACKNDLATISCKCTRLRFAVVPHQTRPSPAGVLLVTCDGQPLPLQVEADGFNTERAP